MPLSTKNQSKANLAAICVRIPGNDLISAECAHLTGGIPDADGFAFCKTVEYVPQAAYVRTGLRILASGPTLDDLLEAVVQADFPAQGFRIDVRSLSRGESISARASILQLADAIPFHPNLEHPQHRFLLVERDSGLWFGEIITESQRTYRAHDAKPFSTSTSLSSQLSRALVNLVTPSARSLLDPCCGTGAILLEARSIGLKVYGSDLNEMMVRMARQNLAHFGYDAYVEQSDARDTAQTADALVTDLPYGRLLDVEESVIRAIFEHGRKLASEAVYVAGFDLSAWLAAAGYEDIKVYTVSKHARITRYVHLARCSA